MSAVLSWVTSTFLTEKMLKKLVVTLGDYLVKSSKNKLDDVLWSKVRKVLLG